MATAKKATKKAAKKAAEKAEPEAVPMGEDLAAKQAPARCDGLDDGAFPDAV